MLFVNELFASIQGEGSLTGVPAVFVRMQGCLCQCPWCDTKFTWKLGDKDRGVALKDILTKADRPGYAATSADELADHIIETYPLIPWVIITGGEPCLFDLTELCQRLEAAGKRIQIETSGTEPVRVTASTHVTVSPKVAMPGGKTVLTSALMRADEIKMVVDTEADLVTLNAILERANPQALVSLQPLSQKPEATKLALETVMKRGTRYRLSVQTHKYLNVR